MAYRRLPADARDSATRRFPLTAAVRADVVGSWGGSVFPPENPEVPLPVAYFPLTDGTASALQSWPAAEQSGVTNSSTMCGPLTMAASALETQVLPEQRAQRLLAAVPGLMCMHEPLSSWHKCGSGAPSLGFVDPASQALPQAG